jgi:hypothetical protein
VAEAIARCRQSVAESRALRVRMLELAIEHRRQLIEHEYLLTWGWFSWVGGRETRTSRLRLDDAAIRDLARLPGARARRSDLNPHASVGALYLANVPSRS